MFVPTELVPVSDDNGNTIYILPKMGRGVRTRVGVELDRLGATRIASYELALLYHNVKKWEGPAFTQDGDPVPCTRGNIDLLDVEEELIVAVLQRIDELNPAPKKKTNSTS